jgi:hypothetical protein
LTTHAFYSNSCTEDLVMGIGQALQSDCTARYESA